MLNKQSHHNSGFGMVVIMIVVVIIMVLVILQINNGQGLNTPAVGPAGRTMDPQVQALEEMNQERFFTPRETTQPTSGVVEPTPTPIPRGSAPELKGQLYNITRTRNIARELNVKVLNENLVMWKLNNPGKEVTIENLRNTGFQLPGLKPNQEYIIRNENIDIIFK